MSKNEVKPCRGSITKSGVNERGRVSTLDISIYQCIFLLMATTLKKSSHLCMKEKNMSNVETRPHLPNRALTPLTKSGERFILKK